MAGTLTDTVIQVWARGSSCVPKSAEQGYKQYLFTQLLTVLSYVKYLIQCQLQRRAPQGAVYGIMIKSKTLQPDCLHLKAALLFPYVITDKIFNLSVP